MRKIVVYLNNKVLRGFSVEDNVKDEDVTDELFQEVLAHLDWGWEEVDEWPRELGGKEQDRYYSITASCIKNPRQSKSLQSL